VTPVTDRRERSSERSLTSETSRRSARRAGARRGNPKRTNDSRLRLRTDFFGIGDGEPTKGSAGSGTNGRRKPGDPISRRLSTLASALVRCVRPSDHPLRRVIANGARNRLIERGSHPRRFGDEGARVLATSVAKQMPGATTELPRRESSLRGCGAAGRWRWEMDLRPHRSEP